MKPFKLFIIVCVVYSNYSYTQTYTTVSTFAGTTAVGLLDGPNLSAKFHSNYGICTDSSGTVWVADGYNNCIRKITGGNVTTVAGNGMVGDVDGQGSNARFNFPTGVYYKNGYLYICDDLNSKIKRMDMSYNVVTIAGTGAQGYLDGPALSAKFYQPKSILVDSINNVFVCDYENHCIRKIANGNVTTIAGVGGVAGDVLGPLGTAKLHRPREMVRDGAGNFYVVDLGNYKIKKIDPSGTISFVAGSGASSSIDGTGAGASFNAPVGIVWSMTGDLFVMDAGSGKIRKVTTSGVTTTIAGVGTFGYLDGPVMSAKFGSYAQSLAMDLGGNLYVADQGNNCVRILQNSFNATFTSVSCTCYGTCDGTATVTPSGGNAPYTFSWSPAGGNAATASGLCAGNYLCTITDSNGMTTSVSVNVPQPTPLSAAVTSTNITCNSQCNGTAVVSPSGGNGTYSFNWLPSGGNTATANGLCPGSYSCTITDQNGCFSSVNISITEPPSLSAIVSSVSTTCGQSNGVASISANGGTGPYSFQWSNSQNTSTITGLSSGTYSVTVTDANGCIFNDTAVIQPSALPILSVNSTSNVSCNGGSNGAASMTPFGGSPPYTYSWSPAGGNSSLATNLVSGNYTLTATDNVGCIFTQSVQITQPTALQLSMSNVNAHCTVNDGSVGVSVSGGTPGYSYQWNTGATNDSLSNVPAGLYAVAVTDMNGCVITGTTSVGSLSSAFVDAGADMTIDSGQVVQLNAAGNGVQYSWQPSNGLSCVTCPDPFASPGTTTTYYVLVTDSAGCTAIDSITINVEIPCGAVFVPNAFSPNGDGQNDILYVRGRCIDEVDFRVFNRWGECVFRTNDISIGWNGEWRGVPCETEVFTYYLKAKLLDGTVSQTHGNISLIK